MRNFSVFIIMILKYKMNLKENLGCYFVGIIFQRLNFVQEKNVYIKSFENKSFTLYLESIQTFEFNFTFNETHVVFYLFFIEKQFLQNDFRKQA